MPPSPRDTVDVVFCLHSLASGDEVKLRQPAAAHHPPNQDLERLLYSLVDGDFTAAVGVNPVILAIWRLKQLEWRLVRKQHTSPLRDRAVLACFCKRQPFALLDFGQFRPATQSQRLQM